MQTKINRRNFLKNTTMTSIGMAIAPTVLQSASKINAADIPEMMTSGGILPVLVIDNACMLAFRSGELNELSQLAATSDIHVKVPGNKGRMATVLPPKDIKIIELIKLIKNNPGLKHRAEKLAIAFGWTGINAIERNIKPLFKNKNAEATLKMRINQDAVLINEFSKPEHDLTRIEESDMKQLLFEMFPRALTRVHTLKPDNDDGIGWVNRMAEWRRENMKNLSLYAKALVHPDPELAGNNFYDKNDLIIGSANKLQKSKNEKAGVVLSNISNKEVKSAYGKSLQETCEGILAINEYLEGKLTDQEVTKAVI